ncbi:glycosyltransferase family 4 protein [Chloroflexota bacterium]
MEVLERQPMKIALVSPYDFSFPGGVCNHISCLERCLTQMGHLVKVIAPASRAVTTFGDRFIPIGKPRPVPASGSICRVTISPWLSSRIKTVFDAEQFDIVHLHEPFMPMLCTTVLRLSPTATVGTFHAVGGRPGYNFGKPLSTILLKRWFHRLHGKIAVSRPAMEFAHKYFPGYYNIIPNGVDLEHFSPDVLPIDEFCDGKVNILFVGRLEKRKGLNYLLDAYQVVKGDIPNCRLIVVGPGTRLRRKYEKRVRRRAIKDVVFVGQVSYDELPRYYKTADVFCSPATDCESFGVVLLEAMAIGKPIVASNIEGYTNVVTHGAEGLLVPPRNREKLAQALATLITDEPLRQQMGARGKVKAPDYNWKRISQQVYNYYVRVLSEPPWQKRSPKFEAMSVTSK